MRASIATFSLLIGLISCTEQTPPTETATLTPVTIDRPALDQLSELEAKARKERVSNIAYRLEIDLASETESYSGTVVSQFDLATNNGPLDIDFTGGSVSQVIVNGEVVTPNYNGFYVLIPDSAMAVGRNEVEIQYSHPFDQDGTGLHKFVTQKMTMCICTLTFGPITPTVYSQTLTNLI